MVVAEMTLLAVLAATLANMARSVARASTGNAPSPQKGSPKKKDMTQIKVSRTKQARKLIYVFKVLKLKADIEIIWCEKLPRDDAFIHPLLKDIEDNESFREHGIITVVRRHMSHLDNTICFNANDPYPRRLIVRIVDESTPES
jgi:hypothetical protein